jgi:predicted ArsR family transcriptional regulator
VPNQSRVLGSAAQRGLRARLARQQQTPNLFGRHRLRELTVALSRPGSSTCLKCAPVAIRGAGRWCALEALLREVGSRLATESGASAHRGTRERVQRAASALEDLGGIVEIEEDRAPRGKVQLRGYSCPLASAAASHPEVCRLIESFLAEVVGAPVKECCEREGRPRCCFEMAVGRQRAA